MLQRLPFSFISRHLIRQGSRLSSAGFLFFVFSGLVFFTPATLSAQTPTVSYATPQTYYVNELINTLSPTANGVAAPGYSTIETIIATPHNPMSVALDPAGDIYYTTDAIGYEAQHIMELPVGGGTPIAFGYRFQSLRSIAFDNAGNLYAVDRRGTGATTGVILKFAPGSNTPVIFASGLNSPDQVAIDKAGNVYVTETFARLVKEYPVGGGSPVILGSGFYHPEGIYIDVNGNVYVMDYDPGTVYLIKAGNNGQSVIGTGFRGALGITVDGAGNTYAADYDRARIAEIAEGSGNGIQVGPFGYFFGLTMDPYGIIYAANYDQSRIVKITPTGGYFISPGLPPGLKFNSATGMISGTPTAASPDTKYMITGWNANGKTTTSVNIRVLAVTADLTSLAISNGTLNPAFSAATTGYTASVPNNITSVKVTPTSSDPRATIMVNGTAVASGAASGDIPLNIGVNAITTKVTTYDGSATKTYTIQVTRAASAVATLSNLTVSSGTLAPAFASATNNYTDDVSNATASITVTPTVTDPNSTVTVNGASVTSGAASASIPLTIGNNTITTVVTAQDGTTKSIYTVVVKRAASAVATLSNLTISSGTLTPVFSGGTTTYTDDVSNATASVTVTPTVTDATAKVTVNGGPVVSGAASASIPLNVGTNIITTVVTAQDGTTKGTYTITVTRDASTVATLSNLTISSGTLTPVFTSGTTNYTEEVSNTTSSITVTPTTTDTHSTITVNGSAVTSGMASSAIPLNVGTNTVTTVVTAQDGTTKGTYTITVTRDASAVATLSNLTISSGTLTPAFASGTIVYSDEVSNAITSVTVTPTVTDAHSTITVNGSPVTSGTASSGIPLNVGTNTITTVVTAQDGTTKGTYTITVTRDASAIATLSNLTISSGTLSPAFASSTTDYTDEVSNATTSVTVTPTVTDAHATITVNGATVTSGTASAAIPLTVGTNTITTVLTAQDGTTKGIYTITVTRDASAVATLSNLTISSGTLTPVFASGTTTYIGEVSNATASVTVTPTVTDTHATVTVNGTTVTSGAASQSILLNNGTNTITTVVTAQDGTTKGTYTITVTRDASATATLADLTISSGTLSPAFASGTTTYIDEVSNLTTSVTVSPTATDANSTITVNGNTVSSGAASQDIPLNIGANTITTVVTAQDGTTKGTYTIIVTLDASSIATLSNLTISSGTLSPAFVSGTTSYSDEVSNAITSVTVTPTVTDAHSTTTVNGAAVTSGSASAAIPLNIGTNTITVVVTAQDGTTKGTYTISVSRDASAIAILANLTISSGTLNPAFAPATTSYTDEVGNATTSVTVTPTFSDPASTITVNGTPVTSGSASVDIPLIIGSNTITTVVTAQDGSTKGIYTITVTRSASATATLANLTISSGTLTPTFSAGTTNYTDEVTNATTSVTVTPTAADANSTITVNGTTVASATASQNIPLNIGTNTITTVVTAQDGTTKGTYIITVTRDASATATLANLTISSGTLSPAFASGTINYTDEVGNATTSVTVTPTFSDPASTITVNGTPVTSGSASADIPLNMGSNTITAIVTAQDGTTKGTYTITVTRSASATATLANLTVSSGILTPAFSAGTTNYTDEVTNITTSVKITPTATDANSTIAVNGATVASGTASADIPLNIGTNVITTTVTAQDGTTKGTYSITVTRDASAIATLANLTISSGTLTPAFASGTTNYTDEVGNAITSVTVTPTVTNINSTVTINGTPVSSGAASQDLPLNVGVNTITIVVTAQDGTTKGTYTIAVTRDASADATLANLTISSGTLSPAFASGTTNYTDEVSSVSSSVTVTPTTTDANATITVNGTSVTSGTTSQTIPLNIGTNTITTLITAQDGTTKSTYTIIVTRDASATATLANLTVSSGKLSPAFDIGTTNYTDEVSNATTSVTVTPTGSDPTSTITVNGTLVASGTASANIPLNIGTNTITTVVTAQDGSTTGTYTITVTRNASAMATLAKLTISSGTLSPIFASGTTNYTDEVSNTTAAVTVTPTFSDPASTITVNGTAVASGSGSQSIPLNIGTNTITTVVTAQDGTTKGTYTITVTRDASAMATLANLTISSGTLSPTFASGITSYTDEVGNGIASVTVTPTVTDANSAIIVNGSTVASGTASQSIPLKVGQNSIITVVTAQDGTTKGIYTIVITRDAAAIATLTNLTISSGTLTPAFESGTTGYTDVVDNSIKSVTVTPTATDVNATITVNGATVASGTSSEEIQLNAGINTITTTVTARDGITKDTYTINITRAKADQVITFNHLAAVSYGVSDFNPGATSSSGLQVSYTSSNTSVATIVNGEIHIVGVGITTITATVAGNGSYNPAPSVDQQLVVNKGSQVINATVIPALLKGTTIDLSNITASSGLPVTFSVENQSIASVSGQTLSALQIGSTILTISQPGNDLYNAASVAIETITVYDAAGDEIIVHQVVTPNGDGKNDFLQIEGIEGYPDNSVLVVNRTGIKIFQSIGYDNVRNVFDGRSNVNQQLQPAGTYFYMIEFVTNGERKSKKGFFVLKY